MYEVQFHSMFGPCETALPEPMELDDWDEAREVFTSGQCHAFAIAGAELLGAVVIGRGLFDEMPCGEIAWNHLGIFIPGGDYSTDQVLDIDGLHDLEDWLDPYEHAVSDADDFKMIEDVETEILKLSNGDPNTGAYWPPNLEAGRAYAEHVARQYDLLPG